MAELTAVSKERHAGRTWQRPLNYFFAAKDPVVTLVSQEIPRALLFMPLGFIESDGTYHPVAIQGLKQGQNKFVSRDGRWLADYVPAVYRAYPFRLARNQDGAELLCVDEAAGKVNEHSNGEPFFLPDGTLAQAVTDAFKLLVELEKDRQKTRKACAALAKHGLLEPWPLRMQDGEEVLQAGGIFRIAEARLHELDAAALVEVRDSGALVLAFSQLLSMQQVIQLNKLSAASQQAPVLNITDANGIISFGNL